MGLPCCAVDKAPVDDRYPGPLGGGLRFPGRQLSFAFPYMWHPTRHFKLDKALDKHKLETVEHAMVRLDKATRIGIDAAASGRTGGQFHCTKGRINPREDHCS